MKFTILAIATLSFFACQNENTSEVERKRQELEDKRKELQEKKEIANLKQELKSVESEIKSVDGVKTTESGSSEPRGSIKGQNVSLRESNSAQSKRLAVLNSGENVKILSKRASGSSTEAILTQATTVQENGQSYNLPKGKSVVIQQFNNGNDSYYVSFSTDNNPAVYTWLNKSLIEKIEEKDWFQVQRKDGTTGWVLGDFITIL